VTDFIKGAISEEELDAAMAGMQAELATLPLPGTRSDEERIQAALSAGETLGTLAEYWSEATAEERRDLVWSLLPIGGLVYDLERQAIVGLLPRESVLPVLSLGLEASGHWEQRDGGLWLREEYRRRSGAGGRDMRCHRKPQASHQLGRRRPRRSCSRDGLCGRLPMSWEPRMGRSIA
jgi:hypothetical protein